tara:strand:- start:44 stop:1384 length:1341 start_codon:yes stop_codon:yes gene_type:complete
MAIIYTYPSITSPNASDLLLISDSADKNKTKSIKISNLPGGTTSGVQFLTTTGTSGEATLASGVLNIPIYSALTGTINKIPYFNSTSSLADTTITYDSAAPSYDFGTSATLTAYQLFPSNIQDQNGEVGGANEVLTAGGSGASIIWAAQIDTGITGVTLATGTGASAPLAESITNRELTITSNKYGGTTQIGYVPEGGTSTTFLRGDGTWAAGGNGETYILSAETAAGSTTSSLKLTDSQGAGQTIKIVGADGISIARNSAAQLTISGAPGVTGYTVIDMAEADTVTSGATVNATYLMTTTVDSSFTATKMKIQFSSVPSLTGISVGIYTYVESGINSATVNQRLGSGTVSGSTTKRKIIPLTVDTGQSLALTAGDSYVVAVKCEGGNAGGGTLFMESGKLNAVAYAATIDGNPTLPTTLTTGSEGGNAFTATTLRPALTILSGAI